MGKERTHFSNRVPFDAITHTRRAPAEATPRRRVCPTSATRPRGYRYRERHTCCVHTCCEQPVRPPCEKNSARDGYGNPPTQAGRNNCAYACAAGPFNSNKRNTFNDWVVSHTRIHKHYTLQSLTTRTPQRKSHDSNQPTGETVLSMRRFLGPSMSLHKDSFMSGLNA